MSVKIEEFPNPRTFRPWTGRKRVIEQRFNAPIETIVRDMYIRYKSLRVVAMRLGTSRRTLYVWIGKEKIQRWKMEARQRQAKAS